ncbi:MAG: hypothetical protein JWQ40_808 [Segetibacter sp.]|jgi:hypothetical protein|nr:hypothetical protein [Segetibacter sp.]
MLEVTAIVKREMWKIKGETANLKKAFWTFDERFTLIKNPAQYGRGKLNRKT